MTLYYAGVHSCLKFERADEIIPVFSEQELPPIIIRPKVPRLEDHLSYITDDSVRTKVSALLDDVKQWKPGRIALDATTYAISMKVDGHVFAYLGPRRKHFVISTYNTEDTWTEYAIHGDDDLQNVLPLMRTAMDKRVG